jgi:hypothetical protein
MQLSETYIETIRKEGNNKILVCTTPVSIPLPMFRHTFVVVFSKGEVYRYEVFRKWGEPMPKHGVVCKDAFAPWEGNSVFLGILKRLFGAHRFSVRVLQELDVDDNTIQTIQRIYSTYPKRHFYRYWGPNSNTFTQWLLHQVQISYVLPWNAIGKNYRL